MTLDVALFIQTTLVIVWAIILAVALVHRWEQVRMLRGEETLELLMAQGRLVRGLLKVVWLVTVFALALLHQYPEWIPYQPTRSNIIDALLGGQAVIGILMIGLDARLNQRLRTCYARQLRARAAPGTTHLP